MFFAGINSQFVPNEKISIILCLFLNATFVKKR